MTGKPETSDGADRSFVDIVRDRGHIFDDMEARPGPSGLDPEYSDSLIPEHMRERTMAVRRKRRAAAKQKPNDAQKR